MILIYIIWIMCRYESGSFYYFPLHIYRHGDEMRAWESKARRPIQQQATYG